MEVPKKGPQEIRLCQHLFHNSPKTRPSRQSSSLLPQVPKRLLLGSPAQGLEHLNHSEGAAVLGLGAWGLLLESFLPLSWLDWEPLEFHSHG